MIVGHLDEEEIIQLGQSASIYECNTLNRRPRQHTFWVCILPGRDRPARRDVAHRQNLYGPGLDIESCDILGFFIVALSYGMELNSGQRQELSVGAERFRNAQYPKSDGNRYKPSGSLHD
jgi:hypothetical protein